MATKDADFYGGVAPEQVPAYTMGEAADYLQLPRGTVRNWTVGMTYQTKRESRRFRPVILVADPKTPLLSFENLVELHVLSSLRREHEVRLEAVRKAVRYLAESLSTQHPLADADMSTDGVDIFVERYGKLVNASRDGQQAMREVVQKYLTRIERNPGGKSVRLYPITTTGIEIDQAPKRVAIDPRCRFGRPFLVDCGVETSIIAGRLRAGDSIDDLAKDYEVKQETIEEALRYELRSAA